MGRGWGLSAMIGFKAAVMFLFFAYLRSFGFTLLSMPFLYTFLISLLISIASHPSINLPLLLGKNPDGSFPIWSRIMFSPYLLFVRGFSALRRLRSGEALTVKSMRDCMSGDGLLPRINCRPETLLSSIVLVNCQEGWNSRAMPICVSQLGIRGLLSRLRSSQLFSGLAERELRRGLCSSTVHMNS